MPWIEGIVFDFLRNPVRILGNDQGQVIGMEVQKYELYETLKSNHH
jgi:glutamate synthase (NADPH/NADH) small chain